MIRNLVRRWLGIVDPPKPVLIDSPDWRFAVGQADAARQMALDLEARFDALVAELGVVVYVNLDGSAKVTSTDERMAVARQYIASVQSLMAVMQQQARLLEEAARNSRALVMRQRKAGRP